MKVVFRSVAQGELKQALLYYRDIDPALAVRFLREVESAMDRLLPFPESGHPRLEGRYRLAMVRGFPYAIAYSHTEAELVIEAIAHLRRKPNYWRDLRG
ncbi:MAG: type II toxin-antitoxin system RelE/ParE family toxin [Opitutales bacterium]|nr:type II toxin-antitoxin system RelE/ParE family toxin [Opitutales bacterium]